MNNLDITESHLFDVIKEVLRHFRSTDYKFASGDSTTVRAYTPYKRDIGDIDLIFHSNTDPARLKNYILAHLDVSKYETEVPVQNGSKKGSFFRTRFKIDVLYKGEYFFIVDFHVGGSVYYENFAVEVDDFFFDGITWKEVKSMSGLEKVKMPVPKVEEALLFKLKKFIKTDKQDILSLLTLSNLDMEYLKNRLAYYSKSIVLENINYLDEQLDIELLNWDNLHSVKMSGSEKETMRQNIVFLKNMQ